MPELIESQQYATESNLVTKRDTERLPGTTKEDKQDGFFGTNVPSIPSISARANEEGAKDDDIECGVRSEQNATRKSARIAARALARARATQMTSHKRIKRNYVSERKDSLATVKKHTKANTFTVDEAERILLSAELIEPPATEATPNELPAMLDAIKKKFDSIMMEDAQGNSTRERNFLERNKPRKGFDGLHFVMGRTRNRFPAAKLHSAYFRQVEFDGETFTLYIRDFSKSTKPRWMKEIYEDLENILKVIDTGFARGREWVVQVNMSDKPEHQMKPHTDGKDIMPQYAIGLGDYAGGEVATFRRTPDGRTEAVKISIKNKVVKMDGRYWHVACPSEGSRYSIYFFKLWDPNMDKPKPLLFPPILLYAAESQSTHGHHRESTHPHSNNGDIDENNNENNGGNDNDKDNNSATAM